MIFFLISPYVTYNAERKNYIQLVSTYSKFSNKNMFEFVFLIFFVYICQQNR